MRITLAKSFTVAFSRLSDEGRTAVVEAIDRLGSDDRHPSLRFKRLVGSKYFTARANRSIRIVMVSDDEGGYRAVDVGTHDVIRRYG